MLLVIYCRIAKKNGDTRKKNGDDIYLTIDKTIQSFLEEAMSQVEKEYDPESMTAVMQIRKQEKYWR